MKILIYFLCVFSLGACTSEKQKRRDCAESSYGWGFDAQTTCIRGSLRVHEDGKYAPGPQEEIDACIEILEEDFKECME